MRSRPAHLLICTLLAAAGLGLTVSSTALAKPWWMRGVESNENDFLPPDVAFRVYSRLDGNLIRIRWVIADGYYLYRQRMAIAPESPDLRVSRLIFPQGILKTDPYLGNQEIFAHEVEGTAVYDRIDGGAHPMQIKVTYQGCAEAGLCYPPITKVISPASSSSAVPTERHGWEGYAIGGGALAFFLAGLMLRKGRRLPLPA